MEGPLGWSSCERGCQGRAGDSAGVLGVGRSKSSLEGTGLAQIGWRKRGDGSPGLLGVFLPESLLRSLQGAAGCWEAHKKGQI